MRGGAHLAAVVIAVAAAPLSGCGEGSGASDWRYAGQTLQPARIAPDFTARDADGRRVRLSQFRGKAVLLTFVYTRCPDVCPLIVGNLRAALLRAGSGAGRAQVIAVSVDPQGDTPRSVRRFVAAHGMAGRLEYLIGSKAELAPIWRSYGIAVGASPDDREVAHSVLGARHHGVRTAGDGLRTGLRAGHGRARHRRLAEN